MDALTNLSSFFSFLKWGRKCCLLVFTSSCFPYLDVRVDVFVKAFGQKIVVTQQSDRKLFLKHLNFLQVPWKSLGKEPVIVIIDRVFILAHPAPDGQTITVSPSCIYSSLEATLQPIIDPFFL